MAAWGQNENPAFRAHVGFGRVRTFPPKFAYTPGVEFRVFVAAVRDEVAAKISIQLRARAGTPGAPETLTFSYMVGGEQDAPVELRIGDSLYRFDRDDLLAFARAIGGKG